MLVGHGLLGEQRAYDDERANNSFSFRVIPPNRVGPLHLRGHARTFAKSGDRSVYRRLSVNGGTHTVYGGLRLKRISLFRARPKATRALQTAELNVISQVSLVI